MLGLTGIRAKALRKLETRGSAVLELISFVNVRTAALLRPGDRVFLTEEVYEETGPGTEGIVAEVEDVSVDPVRIEMEHVDEKEIQRARIRLRFVSYGRVKNVEWKDRLVDVELILIEHPLIL